MASYDYDERDLPEVVPGENWALRGGETTTIIRVGDWSMEYIDPPLPEGGDTDLEEVDKTILAWISYRKWLAENPPRSV